MRRLPFLVSLLLPSLAFAQATQSTGLPSWLMTVLAGLGLAGGGGIAVMLIHRIAPAFFAWLAGTELPKAGAALKLEIATSAEGMKYPEAVAIVNHQVDCLSNAIAAALTKIGADFGSLSTLTTASLLQVATDAEAAFLAQVNGAQLLSALEALGQAEGGTILGWVKSTILRLLHLGATAPASAVTVVQAPTAKVVETTADGTKIVKPASTPEIVVPGVTALVLACLLFGGGSACSASQKTAEAADLAKAEAVVINCVEEEAKPSFTTALGDVAPILSGGAVNTADLEAVAVKDGVGAAVCATEALITSIELEFLASADGGASVAASDAKAMLIKVESARLFTSKHAHLAKP